MILCNRKVCLVFGTLSLFSIAVALTSVPTFAQEAATEPTTEQPAAEEAAEQEQVDPYQVPDGTPDELMEYLQTAPEQMQPQTRDDALRMFNSMDEAAKRIYESDAATTEQRIEAAGGRLQFLGMLTRLGDAEAGARVEVFLEQAKQDSEPAVQSFAKSVVLQQKLQSWDRLEQPSRDEIIAELREAVSGDNASGRSVAMLMQFADTVSSPADIELAIGIINDSLPALKELEDPEVAMRTPRLEGTVRRLELPGNKMEVDGTLLSGEEVDWESYRGKVVLVDYWATWCGPCIAELPNVLDAYEKYNEKGFDVLGISLDDDRAAVEQFIAARDLPWQTLYYDSPESNGWNHPMAERYAIGGIPQAILVDKQGNVVSMNARGDALDKALEELLGPVEDPEGEVSTDEGEAASKTAQTNP